MVVSLYLSKAIYLSLAFRNDSEMVTAMKIFLHVKAMKSEGEHMVRSIDVKEQVAGCR